MMHLHIPKHLHFPMLKLLSARGHHAVADSPLDQISHAGAHRVCPGFCILLTPAAAAGMFAACCVGHIPGVDVSAAEY